MKLKNQRDLRDVRTKSLKKHLGDMGGQTLAQGIVEAFGGEADRIGYRARNYLKKTEPNVPPLEFCLQAESVLGLPKGTIYREVALAEKKYLPDYAKVFGEIPLRFSSKNVPHMQNGQVAKAAPQAPQAAGVVGIKPLDQIMSERGLSTSKELAEVILKKEGTALSPANLTKLEFQVRHARGHKVKPELAKRIAQATNTPVERLLEAPVTPPRSTRVVKAKPQEAVVPTTGSTVKSREIRITGVGTDVVLQVSYSAERRQLEDANGQKVVHSDAQGRYLRLPVPDKLLVDLLLE